MARRRSKARYGSGMLWQRGRIWHVKWREVRRYPDGRVEYLQHSESTRSEDKQYAQRILNRKLQETGGRRPLLVDPKTVTYEQIRDNYLVACGDKHLRSLKTDKAGNPTLATIPRLDEFFRAYRAADIKLGDLKRFRHEGRAAKLSEVRLNRYMATLRAMFNQAVKDELIGRQEVPPYFPMAPERNEARGAVYIKPEWYRELRKALKEPLRSAFTVAYNVGIRVGEIQRLRWRDLDLKKRTITLPGEITKTGKPRLVFLPKDFDLKPGQPDDLVFALGKYRWQWYKACVAIGAGRWEPQENGRRKYVGALLRHTRHTAVRDMSDAGLEEKRIMETTGHVTRSMFDRYNIGREEDVAASRKAMERYRQAQQRRVR